MRTLTTRVSTLAALIALTNATSISYAACIANGTTLECTEHTISNNSQLPYFDKVIINNTSDASISGPSGWGMYSAGQTLTAKDVDITTSGAKADGIVTKNGSGLISIEKLTIKTTGSSADGINLGSISNNFTIAIGDDAVIDAFGMGVRSNTSTVDTGLNLITLGKNAIITSHEDGDNSGTGSSTGYGVYAGNNNQSAKGDAKVILGDGSHITSFGAEAHAVYANQSGVIELGSTTIKAEGASSHGIYAESGTKIVAGESTAVGSQVYLEGDTAITSLRDDTETKFAIYAKGKDSSVSSYDNKLGANTSGMFTINGDLKAEDAGTIDLRMTDGSTFNGLVNSLEYDASGSLINPNAGTINLDIAGSSSVWNMTGNSVVSNLTLDGSTLKFSEPMDTANSTALVAKTLTVAGNYTSNNGRLILNTALEGDTSVTDKLIVKGDTAGHTDVVVNNIGGNGALTAEGIEIVQVNGVSAGTFANSSRIVAGSYDYFVRSGNTINGADANNWYLISSMYQPPVEPEPEPEPKPEPKPEPEGSQPEPMPEPEGSQPEPSDPQPAPEEKPEAITPVQRPESGSYTANMAEANRMFLTRLHDRPGRTSYIDALTGERKMTSLWMRNVGGHNRSRDATGQVKTQSNRYVLQLGGDVAEWSHNDSDRLNLGIMAGYGNSKSRSKSQLSGYKSEGTVDGYSIGMYSTWYANEADKSGLYVDGWAQYSWFNNSVNGENLSSEKYKSRGLTAAIESGYTFNLGENAEKTWNYFIQPKAQITWMGVKADEFRETNGTQVSAKGDGNIETRLGMRAYMRSGQEQQSHFQPFVEANWLHNTKNFSTTLNGADVTQVGAKNVGELKLGLEGQISNYLTISGNVAQQLGDKGYSDTGAMLGMKYSF